MKSVFERLLKHCVDVYSGKVGRNGMPYILHPLEVMNKVESLPGKIVALAHDYGEFRDVAELETIGDGVGTNKRENFIKEELIKELTKNIGLGNINKTDTERSCLKKQEKRIETLRLGIISAFKSAFDDTRSAFEDRQEEALKKCAMAEEQRAALVARHTEVRTKQIEPLRKNIEKFVTNLK